MINLPFTDENLKRELLQTGTIKEFAEDTVIVQEDSYAKSLPILLKGIIKVVRQDEGGKEILLYYVKPGETCVMSFLSGFHHTTSKIKAVVEEKAEILFISTQQSIDWLTMYPDWIAFILNIYNKRFEELLMVVNSVAFQKMDERLYTSLQRKAEMTSNTELVVTHQQLSDELGTSREVISRLLKQLERDGKIELARHKIKMRVM